MFNFIHIYGTVLFDLLLEGIQVIQGLLDEIISHGDRGAVVPISRIGDLKKDMIDLKNGEFHTDWLVRMANYITADGNKFIPSDLSFEPHSLISVAMPSPCVILLFHHRGKTVQCTVPTHYTDWYSKNDKALQYIKSYLAPLGFSAATVMTITQKLLAVHSGLGKYGRNNICYNDEFGSYMQIMTYVSDLPCDETAWFPLRRMEVCESCKACVASCPTGAIDPNRRLVNSDRCITYYDELPGDSFPAWMEESVHNSVVGCMKCQDCCPANAHNKDNIVMGATFSENETTELLNHKSSEPYSDSLAVKIEATGIPPEYAKPDVFPRNIAILLQNMPD